MKISIIIAIYKDYKALNIVLKSLENQNYKMFEIIIAEDCMCLDLKKIHLEYPLLKINHVKQEDIGFRKNKALNKAIKIAEGEYLIFLDGDCFVHSKFVEAYNELFEENILLVGRRVMLSQGLTDRIKNKFFIPSFFDILFSKSNHKEEGIRLPLKFSRKNINGLIGSNFGIHKNLLLKINGFDEDYEAPGVGEDDDIFMRLKKIGNVNFKSIKNRAIQYHLEHSRKRFESENSRLFDEKKQRESYRCLNGLEKLEE
ncbi:MAG: glycosyltransferase [Fusobacteriaceae bacterium]|nr:glycosyltransferase [Fusobacteriaceae bacterium]